MWIIKNNLIPFNGYKAMFFFGILFTRKSISDRDLNHERIHSKQCLELLGIFFYIWYIIEWLIKLCIYHNNRLAYRNISFEREAYWNDFDLNYINNRKMFNFLKYI